VDHVNALPVQRGIDPARHHVPRAIPRDSCKSREIEKMILEALRDGPKRPAQIGAVSMARKPHIARVRAMIRVCKAICKLRNIGAVVSDDGAWRLVIR